MKRFLACLLAMLTLLCLCAACGDPASGDPSATLTLVTHTPESTAPTTAAPTTAAPTEAPTTAAPTTAAPTTAAATTAVSPARAALAFYEIAVPRRTLPLGESRMPTYAIHDLDHDGVPELLLNYRTEEGGSGFTCEIDTYDAQSDSIKVLGEIDGRGEIFVDDSIYFYNLISMRGTTSVQACYIENGELHAGYVDGPAGDSYEMYSMGRTALQFYDPDTPVSVAAGN
ncbi:MAG: hypothetical protein IK080_02715 [Clostridia bacterium]|nr:hypothetical protein [Clostridia bacterium]